MGGRTRSEGVCVEWNVEWNEAEIDKLYPENCELYPVAFCSVL